MDIMKNGSFGGPGREDNRLETCHGPDWGIWRPFGGGGGLEEEQNEGPQPPKFWGKIVE